MSGQDVGMCDACRVTGVDRCRYRLIRASGDATSRSLALCSSCKAPIEVLLRAVPPKVTRSPIIAEDIDNLVPTRNIIGQQQRPVGQPPE